MRRPPQVSTLLIGATTFLLVQTSVVHSPFSFPSNWLQLGSPALAIPRYVPIQGRLPRRTQGTGARGCMSDVTTTAQSSPTLTLLFGTDVEPTTLMHPVFFWHLSSASSMPVEFALIEPGQAEPLFVKRFETMSAGITSLAIPESTPALVPGRVYRWSVALICNSARRSSDIIAQAQIERLERPSALAHQLASATSNLERAEIYAQNGFWSDSMAVLKQAQNAQPNNPVIVQDQLSLIEQINLGEIAQQERQRLGLAATNTNSTSN